MNCDHVTEQRDHELINQLTNARYASLTSRAVTDKARALIDHLVETLELTEDYRKTRKHKRSAKAQHGLRRAMEGFVGCQSALDRDPGSASKRDPLVLRFERLAFAPSELAGVAETGRARVDV